MSVEIKETSATLRTLNITIPQADLAEPFEKKLSKLEKLTKLENKKTLLLINERQRSKAYV